MQVSTARSTGDRYGASNCAGYGDFSGACRCRDTGSTPALGRSHILQSSSARAPQLLSSSPRACALPQEKPMQRQACTPKLEKACALQGRPSAADHTINSLSSVQFISVTQSCPTLCNPMSCSTPGLPVHHQLPEFTQTQVHRVSDGHPAISSSVIPFSSCLQSLPASGSFPTSQLLA